MSEVFCSNTRCENHNRRCFGPCVEETAIITVGKRYYLAEDLLAIQCETCGITTGEIPEQRPNEKAQDIQCPGCKKKCGEMFFGFMVASSGRRTLWARRFSKIQCCLCGESWAPRYQVAAPLTRRPKPSKLGPVNGAGLSAMIRPGTGTEVTSLQAA